MALSEEVKHALGRPIGRIPSGVYILTAQSGANRYAMLASWVQQASFDPPAVSIALAERRPIGEAIRATGRLALSILPAGDTTLMKKYARGIPEGEDPFAGMATIVTPSGIPALGDALAWLECKVIQTCDFGGDHDLVIAEITAAQMIKDGAPFTHIRGNGFHY